LALCRPSPLDWGDDSTVFFSDTDFIGNDFSFTHFTTSLFTSSFSSDEDPQYDDDDVGRFFVTLIETFFLNSFSE